jgi:hypothetical protein
MRIVAKAVGLVLTMFASACAYMPPVHLDATPGDMEILVGQWKGDYNSPALGRRGTIEFKLEAGEGQAYGAVVMTPQGAGRPYEPNSLGREAEGARMPSTQLLTIRFVRAASGEITGMLDTYWDPDRNCQATTRFRGYHAKGVIEGTFSTTFDCGTGEASGTWQVTHTKPRQTSRNFVD